MRRLVIVEDEKLIRQGILAIIKRAPVEIEEILECKNGEDALAVVKENHVDVLITDIRMPKMDGITLIKKIGELNRQPKILVISGYDDFNYAVEVLRYGVREYILKPIEREKLTNVLITLNNEIMQEENLKSLNKQIENQQFKYMILNKEIQEEEIQTIEEQFNKLFLSEPYIVCCTHYEKQEHGDERQESKWVLLSGVDGHNAFIIPVKERESLIHGELKGHYVGISQPYTEPRDLREAFREAVAARREGFVRGLEYLEYGAEDKEYEKIPKEFTDQFVQLFGTVKAETVLSRLQTYIFQAKMNKIDPEQILGIIGDILEKLLVTYKYIMEMDMEGLIKLRQPFQFRHIQEYSDGFNQWILAMKQHMMLEFEDYKNKEKINQAIQYIHENYAKDLNMAVVSNHMSMNYSLFSLNFKQYTGMNFVNYLKKIRIDEAKKMLEETEDKIIDISQSVGYDNEKHFMKTFKSIYGVSPSEYRRNYHIGRKKN